MWIQLQDGPFNCGLISTAMSKKYYEIKKQLNFKITNLQGL